MSTADSASTFSLSSPRVFDGDTFLDDHGLVIRDGVVAALLPSSQLPRDVPTEAFDAGILAPGFIDLQVNGGGDVLFHNSPDIASLQNMVLAHRRLGTTAMLPTILSGDRQLRDTAIETVTALSLEEPGVLGIHIEGPWFAPQKHGAHDSSALASPTQIEIEAICNAPCRCMLTLAPEVVGENSLQQLTEAGVIVTAGHSQATAEQIDAAQRLGLAGVTHLYNAMNHTRARAPGTVGAALTNDGLWASLIADGHHVHPSLIKLALRSKPSGKLLLVSDAMATVGGKAASFELYGEQIRLLDGKLVNKQGALAGSAIALVDAVRHLHFDVGLPLHESLRMASLYPAEAIGVQHSLGRLREGYRADIVLLDALLTPQQVWAAGISTL